MPEIRSGADAGTIPAEIDRWNWGAFLLNWIWGVGNNTFIALLTLVPFFGLLMPFVLGARGSRWAWRNGRWDDVEHFKRVQRRWAKWGAIIWIGMIVLFGGVFGGLFYGMSHSDAYRLGVSRLEANPLAASVLGTPITTGFPLGAINISGASGEARLNFSATGPKASGRITLWAIKTNGVWSLRMIKLQVDGHEGPIDLMPRIGAGVERLDRTALAAMFGPPTS